MSDLLESRRPVGTQPRQTLALAGWLALTFSATASAVFVSRGGWYATLAKPAWNPPSWLFGPVWTLLYAMMAVAAWLVWREGGWRVQGRVLALYLLQWALNALWTPLFFGLQRPALAFAEILALDVALLATLLAFWRVRRLAAALLVPYALWVAFATVLNFTIWRLNSGGTP
jgi:tryptophan-rich sensory protein